MWSTVPSTFRVEGTQLRTEVSVTPSGVPQFLRVRSE